MLIETDRLLLRPYRPEDFESLHRILSDPRTMAFWPEPFTQDATSGWLVRAIQSHRERGFGRMAMILKSSREIIGDCGIALAEVNGRQEHDLGWIIHREHWRQGLGEEAARAVLQAGLKKLKLKRIVANMPVDHVASRRVAEKIGMRLEDEFLNPRNRGLLTLLFSAP